jgi:hypothetical protein
LEPNTLQELAASEGARTTLLAHVRKLLGGREVSLDMPTIGRTHSGRSIAGLWLTIRTTDYGRRVVVQLNDDGRLTVYGDDVAAVNTLKARLEADLPELTKIWAELRMVAVLKAKGFTAQRTTGGAYRLQGTI